MKVAQESALRREREEHLEGTVLLLESSYNARHLIDIEFDDPPRKWAQRNAANVDGETSKLSPLRKTRAYNYSRYDGIMLLAKPREKGVVELAEVARKGVCLRRRRA
jgi:hypothetical protein